MLAGGRWATTYHFKAGTPRAAAVANPTALLLSAIMMLRHLGETDAASRVQAALDAVLMAGQVRTRDLGGTASTTEFAGAICAALASPGSGTIS